MLLMCVGQKMQEPLQMADKLKKFIYVKFIMHGANLNCGCTFVRGEDRVPNISRNTVHLNKNVTSLLSTNQ